MKTIDGLLTMLPTPSPSDNNPPLFRFLPLPNPMLLYMPHIS